MNPESGWSFYLAWGCGLALAVAAGLLWRERRAAAALRMALDALTTRLDDVSRQDPLTGLTTLLGIDDTLGQAVARADRASGATCVLYIGIDDFRALNDSFGHAAGDAVLVEAASRLVVLVGDRTAAARVGGAEFVLVVDGDAAGARRAAERVLADLARPVMVDGHALSVSCSIGLAAYPAQGSKPRLIPNALSAMRSVRHAGGAAFAEYLPQMDTDQREQAELAADLRVAVERGELMLVYQPKVDARSLQITAAEALLRWQHPKRGVISPTIFIPIAERCGLIGAIGNWVVDEATRQAALWRDSGLRMRVAINVSGYQMRQHDFVDRLMRSLEERALKPSRFTCEITETIAMEDTLVTLQAFERLGRVGVHVSIDDFGTGHSSLATLRRLPVAELKIDRAFVTDLGASRDAMPIAKAIVDMAHALGLRVVAEGVENETQRDLLVALGCDELQGFLFAKPMSAAALGLWAMGDDGPQEFRTSLFADTMPAGLVAD
ncbi:MAG TPA: bifunctional diguanylate cyclase/phosphodiesterase [Rubrivivax sp.]